MPAGEVAAGEVLAGGVPAADDVVDVPVVGEASVGVGAAGLVEGPPAVPDGSLGWTLQPVATRATAANAVPTPMARPASARGVRSRGVRARGGRAGAATVRR
ncbi:hypothetical protein GCM10025862_25420 [Arsenicicoccus piscis]|uniref:Uncharacterized protein n=1 Tax=Arsenicicoccus piscis TaxID=673954 RepID=A0ABQ6HQB0_9MICO|nr:hypothetical protein GCM10025862_25420 [Arsenicicoccus piscis]